MKPGYYYLTHHDGHRSVLVVVEGSERVYENVVPITDEKVISYLKGE